MSELWLSELCLGQDSPLAVISFDQFRECANRSKDNTWYKALIQVVRSVTLVLLFT